MTHETFIATQRETYEEIGVVVAYDKAITGEYMYDETSSTGVTAVPRLINVGDKVYFDAWLAAKFPSEKEGEYLWLVNWADIRAVQHAEQK